MNNPHGLKLLLYRVLPKRILIYLKRRHHIRTVAAANSLWEPELWLIEKLLQPGDVVVDVGANIGVYTKVMSKLVGPTGRVYSFEPVPETYNTLVASVEALNLSNVLPSNVALADTEGVMTMSVPRDAHGVLNYYESSLQTAPSAQPGLQIEVMTRRLEDVIAQEPQKPSFIKIDVEGAELSCLSGANNLLQQGTTIWMVEVTTSEPEKVFSLFESAGYLAFWCDGKQLHPRAQENPTVNFFFFPKRGNTVLRAELLHGILPSSLS